MFPNIGKNGVKMAACLHYIDISMTKFRYLFSGMLNKVFDIGLNNLLFIDWNGKNSKFYYVFVFFCSFK